MPDVKKIVLADPDDSFRDGLKQLIEKDFRMEVTGMARDCKELAAIQAGKSITVIFDIYLPGDTGAALSFLSSQGTSVIALSDFRENENYISLARSGVIAFVSKSSLLSELGNAITCAADNSSYFSWHVLQQALRGSSDDKKIVASLTGKETEIIRMIAAGYTEEEITGAVKLAHKSFQAARTDILQKTNCSNSASLTLFAVKNQIAEV